MKTNHGSEVYFPGVDKPRNLAEAIRDTGHRFGIVLRAASGMAQRCQCGRTLADCKTTTCDMGD